MTEQQQQGQVLSSNLLDGLSLNIVAEPAAGPPTKKRKRRLNKYERKRRQKAAKRQQEQQQQEEKEDQQDEGQVKPSDEEQRGQETNNSEAENSGSASSKKAKVVGKSAAQPEAKGKQDSDGKGAVVSNEMKKTTSKTSSSTTASTKSKSQSTTSKNGNDDNDAEHAAYMAEYHARPLELDRRSGATIKKIGKRKATTTRTSQDDKTLAEWKDFPLDPKIVNLLPHPHPTLIQQRSIQALLHADTAAKKNLWIQSETGSGKSLAYFLPILQHLWSQQHAKATNRATFGTRCIIICPTQELVQQTQTVLERLVVKLCAGQLVVGALRGQASRSKEKARIRKGLGIICSTPGRLLDHLQTTQALQTAVSHLKWLVLDEVDRLFDMGLAPQLQKVIDALKEHSATHKWRSILVSATVPSEVRTTVQQALSSDNSTDDDTDKWAWVQGDDKEFSTDSTTLMDGGGRSLPKQLVQYHILVSAKLRLSTLIAFLSDRVTQGERTVVFMSTCASVDYFHALFAKMDCILKDKDNKDGEKRLLGRDCAIDRLHGNVPHYERQSILKSFTTTTIAARKARILLATDVAARGLNLHADWTVQYDPPCEIADYIHRAGRVARAGQQGQSLLFLLPSEKGLLDILRLRQQHDAAMPALSLTSTLQRASQLCPDLTQAGLQRNGMMRQRATTTPKPAATSDATPTSSNSSRNGSRQGEAFCSELQYRLEECVLEQSASSGGGDKQKQKKRTTTDNTPTTLLELARAAFLSHMRAYPTKEKIVRHLFSARALHLGHVAKSFALRETPKTLVQNSKNSRSSSSSSSVGSGDKKKKRSAALAFSKRDDKDKQHQGGGKTTADKRAMLMANAAKLQVGGLHSL